MHILPALQSDPQTQGRVARPLQPDFQAKPALPPRSIAPPGCMPISRIADGADHPRSHSTPTAPKTTSASLTNAKSRGTRSIPDALQGCLPRLAKPAPSSPSPSGLSRCQARCRRKRCRPLPPELVSRPWPRHPDCRSFAPVARSWVQRARKGWRVRQTIEHELAKPKPRIALIARRTLNTESISLCPDLFPALLGSEHNTPFRRAKYYRSSPLRLQGKRSHYCVHRPRHAA